MATEVKAHQEEIIELDSQMERVMKIKKEVETSLIDERKSIFAVEKQIDELELKHGIATTPKVDLEPFKELVENLNVEKAKSKETQKKIDDQTKVQSDAKKVLEDQLKELNSALKLKQDEIVKQKDIEINALEKELDILKISISSVDDNAMEKKNAEILKLNQELLHFQAKEKKFAKSHQNIATGSQHHQIFQDSIDNYVF